MRNDVSVNTAAAAQCEIERVSTFVLGIKFSLGTCMKPLVFDTALAACKRVRGR